ncbi:LacI family DNA-binding transcriptional regulator [Planctomicrobium sp. SH668]|uniref:LacI family DNA-binding transcriptional regulator n=1 Tax=Planctomicrobium sp. SH668 TaxID=3448126 RepID=UPI003F5B1F29
MSTDQTKVRLVDIARKAGVSRAAVGHVLNHSGADNVRVSQDTRERILKIAREMNYRPNRAAQQLRGRPTKMLGVILNTVNTSVFSARLSAIEIEAHRRGYRMVIGQVHGSADEIRGYLDDFLDRGIDGVLCLFDVMNETRSELAPVFENRQGIVWHASPVLSSQPYVRVDTASAIRQIMDHLIAQGRRRIGLELWSESDQLMSVRQEAWKEAHRAHGLEIDEKLIWIGAERSQLPTRSIVENCIQQLVLQNGADAIVASNDEWAASVVQGLRRHGKRVPEDVAVTGYDNLPLCEIIEPSMTSIDQSHAEYATAALDLIEYSLRNPNAETPEIRVIQPKLVIRESTE